MNFSNIFPHSNISFAHSIRAIDNFVTDHNQANPQLTHQLRHTHKQTLYELLRMWAGQINQTPPQYRKGLKFRTSHAALATRLGCSKRTAQRYTARLDEAGAISKTFNGSNTTVTIAFAPGLVVQYPNIQQITPSIENQPVTKEVTTTRPHTSNLNSNEKKKQAVEKLAHQLHASKKANFPDSIDSDTRTTRTNRDTQGGKVRANHDTGRKGTRGANGTQQPGPAYFAKLYSLVARLWTFAEAVFYVNRPYLTSSQQNYGIEQIMRELTEVRPDQLDVKYYELMGAMWCVQTYLKGNPNRYVPLPSVYFDPDNDKGFQGAKRWHANQRRKGEHIAEMKREFTAQTVLFRASREAIRAHMRNPYDLETYRQTAQRLGKLDPALLNTVNHLITSGQLTKAS